MTKFKTAPSKLYLEALGMLSRLLEAENLDAVRRVLADATWEAERTAFIENHGIKPTGGNNCICRLFGKGSSQRCTCRTLSRRLPRQDHVHLWLKDGKPHIFTSQPYTLNLQDLSDMVQYCKQYGLDLRISTDCGFHFPGSIMMVEVKKKALETLV